MQLTHSRLREFAYGTAWIATVAEAAIEWSSCATTTPRRSSAARKRSSHRTGKRGLLFNSSVRLRSVSPVFLIPRTFMKPDLGSRIQTDCVLGGTVDRQEMPHLHGTAKLIFAGARERRRIRVD
jgi:hypothetical protein